MISTSLVPLDTMICVLSFSCTVWTKMRSLAGSLVDGVPDGVLANQTPF